jgi:5,10-methylenetetrahydrofolate reductase
MKIAYELNPPKIVKGVKFDLAQLNADIQKMVERVSQLKDLVNGIHFTDSVLGIPRMSGITAANYIKIREKELRQIKISCSVRVRDRNYVSLCQIVSDAIIAGIDSLLLLMGDEPIGNLGDSGLRPSMAVKMLKKEGYDSYIHLNLSSPAKLDTKLSLTMQNKLEAKPYSLVTQSISSLADLGRIVDIARPCGIKVIAVIMVPSDKNKQSSSIIGLDWSYYEKDVVEFIYQAAKMADEVVLTSPNSFQSGMEILRQLK